MLWLSTRVALLIAAVLAGRHGYRILWRDPVGFNDALPWYTLSLALMAAAAVDGLPNVRRWSRRVAAYVVEHPVELAILAVVMLLGVFVRFWQWGDLPPDNFIGYEEIINASVAQDIREGARPLNYPLVRYSTAAGLEWFGESTTGFRLPFYIWSLASIPLFYLLMRQLAAPPAALFATAIFASLHALADVTFHFPPGVFASILLSLALIGTLRFASSAWALVLAVACAALSYEYESFKLLPLVTGVFVAMAAAWYVLWPLRRDVGVYASRAGAMIRRYALPAAVFTVAIIVLVSPMIARTRHGEHIYNDSLNRNQVGREGSRIERLFSPHWEDNLDWVIEAYTPTIKGTYPRSGPIDAQGITDTTTSLLLWAATAGAILTFWKPYRLFFLGWFVGGSLALALLIANFGIWKAVGFLVPAVVLVGLLTDEVIRLLPRGRLVAMGTVAVLTVLAATVLISNMRIMNRNSESAGAMNAFSLPDSRPFAACTYLQDRPEGTYAFLTDWLIGGGFAAPRTNRTAERLAWQNHYVICKGLDGAAVAAGAEAWPIPYRGNRPLSVAFTETPDKVDAWIAMMRQAMPGLPQPTRIEAPAPVFSFATFDLDNGSANAWRGLWDPSAEEVVDPARIMRVLSVNDGSDDRRLQALVYIDNASERALTLENAVGTVMIGGQPSSVPGVPEGQSLTWRSYIPGWHVVDVVLESSTPDGRLVWSDGSSVRPVRADELFALADRNGWQHVRFFEGRPPEHRFDYAPYIALERLTAEGPYQNTEDTTVLVDVWTTRWIASEGPPLRLDVLARANDVTLQLDGATLERTELYAAPDGSYTQPTYLLTPDGAEHTLTLTFIPREDSPFVGGELTVTDEQRQPAAIELLPF